MRRSSVSFSSSLVRRWRSRAAPAASFVRRPLRGRRAWTGFPDSKAFADATAKSPPPEILALYHAQKPNSLEGLKRFEAMHFDLPAQASTPEASSDQVPIRRHIDALWTLLTRDELIVPPYSSLLPLSKPYVVPGGRFRELYYWDLYFVMLGLAESGERILLQDMATNFADLIDTYGHAPNGTRTYYLAVRIRRSFSG